MLCLWMALSESRSLYPLTPGGRLLALSPPCGWCLALRHHPPVSCGFWADMLTSFHVSLGRERGHPVTRTHGTSLAVARHLQVSSPMVGFATPATDVWLASLPPSRHLLVLHTAADVRSAPRLSCQPAWRASVVCPSSATPRSEPSTRGSANPAHTARPHLPPPQATLLSGPRSSLYRLMTSPSSALWSPAPFA